MSPRRSKKTRGSKDRAPRGKAGRDRSAAKKSAAKKKAAAKPGGGEGQRVTAFLLAVLAFLVAASALPLQWLGGMADQFRAGNLVGATGADLNALLRGALGLGAATVPAALLAGAASLGGWWPRRARRHLWVATAALAALLPVAGFLVEGGGAGGGGAAEGLEAESAPEPARGAASLAGVLGRAVGGPLFGGFEPWVGWVILVAVAVVAVRLAYGLNPLRPFAVAGKAAGGVAVKGLRRSAAAARGRWKAAAARRAAKAAEAAKAAAEPPARPARQPFGGGAAGAADEPGAEFGAGAALGQGAAAGRDAAAEPEVAAGGDGAAGDRAVAAPTAGPGAGADAEAAGAGRAAAADPPEPERWASPDEPAAEHPCPPFDLLAAPQRENRFGMQEELKRLGGVLVNTLATFKIKSRISGLTTGPAVTQYEVVPEEGVRVSRIANLDADLALAMRARSVRIVAPIPGKGAVGVEIPNPRPEIVCLREVLEAPAFSSSRAALPLGMGKNLEGRPYVTDLAKMPHALIAGATGAGKSVCLNTIITSLVYRHGPDRLRLLLIDPKMVELSAYSDLPHLRHSVVTDPRDAASVLKWAVLEMERRYALLSANGVRSLKEFNDRVERETALRLSEPDGPEEDEESWVYKGGALPWIVVVVDELADLMMTVQADVEKPLTQLAQKARAIGIHLLVATQRPSVNVITGLIKANFPCRIAFRVASKTDSRTILDQNGADSLLGYGDMLFLPPGQSEPVRVQGAYISTEETEALMSWYREQAGTLEALKERVRSDEADILEQVKAAEGDGGDDGGGEIKGDWDQLFREAAKVCIDQKLGSTSLLQRRLRIGYGRAARIVDQLEDAGVLGPADGSKPREVLVGHGGLDEICPS